MEVAGLQEQNAALRELLERKRRLAARMEATAAELRTEQSAIDAELVRLLTLSEAQRLAAGPPAR